jgi:hypothetical protein
MSIRVMILEHEGKTFPERTAYGVNMPYGAGSMHTFPDKKDIWPFVRERQNWLTPFGHPRVNCVVRVTLK